MGKDSMSYDEKMQKYIAGRYKFMSPPVYTGNWSISAWIVWIDDNGEWL